MCSEVVTLHHRNKEPGSPQPLFLSFIKPHGPVTSQWLAHWLKEVLGKAGVDPLTFKAYLDRGASSMVAFEKGVQIENILCTADWSSNYAFWCSSTGFLNRIAMPRLSSKQDLIHLRLVLDRQPHGANI